MRLRGRAAALLGAALGLTAGCGDDAASTGAGGGASGPTATTAAGTGGAGGAAPGCEPASVEACLVDQKACSVGGDGAPVCEPCERGAYADPTGTCAPIPGEARTNAFSEFTTQPGEEVLGLCQSWTLGNDTDLWVNAVELYQDVASHHSNWTFVPDTMFDGPDGVWPCGERSYDQLAAAIAGGVIYAQSTQAKHEVQKFPNGAAVRVPAGSRIIGDVHLLNVTATPITGHVELSLYALPEAEVAVKLAPFHMTYDELAIPPRARSRFEGTCPIDDYQLGGQTVASMKLYFLLPHTHALGRRFFFDPSGGEAAEPLFDVDGFNSEARGRAYDPPVEIAGGSGLRFGCEFDNPRDETVTWGFGDLEMCEVLGFIESPIAFESRISAAEPAGEVDGMPVFTGPCDTIVIPWDNKQGSP